MDIDWRNNTAFVKENYDARELDVSVGDELTMIREINDWLLVSTKNGESGWIPKNNVMFTYLANKLNIQE